MNRRSCGLIWPLLGYKVWPLFGCISSRPMVGVLAVWFGLYRAISYLVRKCLYRVYTRVQSPNFLIFKEPKNCIRGINSASLCSLEGQYDNPIPSRFLAPIDCLKIPFKIHIPKARERWVRWYNVMGKKERSDDLPREFIRLRLFSAHYPVRPALHAFQRINII